MAVYLRRSFYFTIFFITLFFPNFVFASTSQYSDNVIQLTPNKPYTKEKSDLEYQIFCYQGSKKSILFVWRTVHLLLENVPEKYDICSGTNATEVQEKLDTQTFFSPSTWFSEKKTSLSFPVFTPYCAGVKTKEQYTLYLHVRTINYWQLLMTLLGIFMFLAAPILSRNTFFHYASCVTFGVLASLLIFIYFISRFMPTKPFSYAVLFFGYSFILYTLQAFYQNLNEIMPTYMDALLAYSLLAAFISFIVCYRLGPVTNVRTINLIQWTMQIVAVVVIYLSSEYREASTAMILVLVTLKIIPSSWVTRLQKLWYRYFPPSIRLLSEAEYMQQGHEETKKALEDLRNFCSSPKCDSWKTIRKIKNPYRFAQFVETGVHCSDEELLHYNSVTLDDFDDFDTDTEMQNRSAGNSFS